MEENPKDTKPGSPAASPEATPKAPEAEPQILKIHGKEFDVSTPEGFQQAQYWGEAVSSVTGRLGQEVGDLRKEVEPLRKYNLKKPDFDEVAIMQKVETLRAEGENVEADRLMFELYRQAKLDTNIQREEDRLWLDYRAQRSELFESIPEDISRDYIFNNYREELYASDDPFGLIDRVLKPKASRIRPPQSSDAPAATLGAGQAGTPPAAPEPKKPEEATSGAWGAMLDEFGFK